MLRINNYREPRPNDATDPSIEADPGTVANTSRDSAGNEELKVDSVNQSLKNESQAQEHNTSASALDSFAIEDIPTKIPIIDPV